MPATPLIAAAKIGMTFPQGLQALAEVDFVVSQGEFVSLIGPSGCGKSTLLRLAAGLQSPTAGQITVGGSDPAAARGGAVPMAFVFQEATLLPWRSVEQNVRLPLEFMAAEQAPATPRGRAAAALQLVGMSDFAASFPGQLSGGMKMRVSLARALVTEPKLLLLDEPFGALDDLSRHQLNEELYQLWRRKRWTALFVTHNIAEAAFLSSRILVMRRRPGTIVADLPVPFGEERSADLRASAEFARFTGQVAQQLRSGGEV